MADENIDDLLKDARTPTVGTRVGYFLIALMPVMVSVLVYMRILGMDMSGSVVTVVTVCIGAAAALSIAYQNIAFVREVKADKAVDPPTKTMFGKGRVAEYESAIAAHRRSVKTTALMYSVFYNNAIYLVATIVLAAYILRGKLWMEISFVISNAVGAGYALFNSRTAVKEMSK